MILNLDNDMASMLHLLMMTDWSLVLAVRLTFFCLAMTWSLLRLANGAKAVGISALESDDAKVMSVIDDAVDTTRAELMVPELDEVAAVLY